MSDMADRGGKGHKSGDANGPIPLRPRIKCPECGSPSDRKAHPFCSRRCADLDLGRWLGGQYRIPDPDGTAALRAAEDAGEFDPEQIPAHLYPVPKNDKPGE